MQERQAIYCTGIISVTTVIYNTITEASVALEMKRQCTIAAAVLLRTFRPAFTERANRTHESPRGHIGNNDSPHDIKG